MSNCFLNLLSTVLVKILKKYYKRTGSLIIVNKESLYIIKHYMFCRKLYLEPQLLACFHYHHCKSAGWEKHGRKFRFWNKQPSNLLDYFDATVCYACLRIPTLKSQV